MRLAYSFVCALVLLCIPQEGVKAQDLSVQVGCSNHPVDILRRGFLRCTYTPALYREVPNPPDSTVLVYSVVPFNSTGRPPGTDPADRTIGVVQVKPRVRRIPRGATSNLRFPFRASVFPTPGAASTLTINPWLADSTRDWRARRQRPDSTYYTDISGNRNFVRFLHRSHGILPFAVPLKIRWRDRALSRLDSVGSTRAAGAISLGAMYTGRIAERSYRYERGATAPIAITGFSWTAGIGVGFSVEEVNKSNTLSSPGVFENRSVNMAIISPTVALMTGYGDFLFGVYGGVDIGLTSGAGAWDFDRAPWVGVGVSTKLPFNF